MFMKIRRLFISICNLILSYLFKHVFGESLNAIRYKVRIQNIFNRPVFGVFTIVAMKEYENNILEVLEASSVFISTGPVVQNEPPVKVEVHVPQLNLYRFDDALVNSYSSCILYNGHLMVESFNSFERFDEGFVRWNDNEKAVVKMLPVKHLPEGLFLAGNGSFNWYHWMVELLPKLLFVDNIPTKTILVNAEIQRFQSIIDTLSAVLKDTSYSIEYLEKAYIYQVERLYHINAISYVPFNMRGDRILGVGDVFMRGDLIRALRKNLFDYFNIEEVVMPTEKIFLKRNTHRVPKNQDKLEKALLQRGYHTVSLDALSLEEQIILMYRSKVVVGTTGAAFTNIMFGHSKSVFISFLPKSFKEFSCFSNLATLMDVALYHSFYKIDSKPSDHSTSKFSLDINSILKLCKIAEMAK